MNAWKDLFVTTCLLSHQTERAAHRLGVRFFLPSLFRLRYANMGGLDIDDFTRQLGELKSFEEHAWCGYWNEIGQQYEQQAEKLILTGAKDDQAQATNFLIKATTYFTVAAFPGHTPLRMDAYYNARRLSDRLLPMLDGTMKRVKLDIAGENVEGYLRFPPGEGKRPFVLVTNGLEGTVQEIALPILKYRHADIGVFLMEMPGTYDYQRPMSSASEEVYRGVIEHFAAHPRVDPSAIAMVGVSFGAYWSARMAAVSPLLRCAVVSGAPLHHAFSRWSAVGTPEIFVAALTKVTGASGMADLRYKLEQLSFEKNDLFHRVKIPTLILNGDRDTLLGTKDSLALGTKAPAAFLKLYENDDHCAMGHYREWLDLTFDWIRSQCQSNGSTVA